MAPLWSPIAGAGSQVLVSPAHPRGYCPIHVFEPKDKCNQWCMQTRIDFAVAAVALSLYWSSPHRRMYERARFGHTFEVIGAA